MKGSYEMATADTTPFSGGTVHPTAAARPMSPPRREPKKPLMSDIQKIAVAVLLSWCSWASLSIINQPYNRDEAAIKQRLQQITDTQQKLTTAVERCTDAINSLRIEVTRLSHD